MTACFLYAKRANDFGTEKNYIVGFDIRKGF